MQLNDYKNQLDNLREERDQALQELEKNILSITRTTDNESQTDDRQHKRLVQSNNKLKNTLKQFKDKIDSVATERPDLFANIDEDTDERLDHLILTIEQLQQNLSQQDNERRSLDERLKEAELELQRTKDDHTSKSVEYDEKLHILTQERDSLLEQNTHRLEEQ